MIDERIFQQYDTLNRISEQVIKQNQCECPSGADNNEARNVKPDKKQPEPEVILLIYMKQLVVVMFTFLPSILPLYLRYPRPQILVARTIAALMILPILKQVRNFVQFCGSYRGSFFFILRFL